MFKAGPIERGVGAAAILSASLGIGATALAKSTNNHEPPGPSTRILGTGQWPEAPVSELANLIPPTGFPVRSAASPPAASTEVLGNTPPAGREEPRSLASRLWLAGFSALITLPGYALALRRGTPPEGRSENPIFKALDRLYPESHYFPNNRATWISSAFTSTALFGLGVLQAASSGASLASALATQAVVGVYALGAATLALHALGNKSRPPLSSFDKVCMTGALCGLGTFVAASLSRLGYLPAVDLPLTSIGIGLGLAVRALALTPLTREFIRCGRGASEPSENGEPKSLPALGAHLFWNAAIIVNLANLPSLASEAAIVPLGMTALNLVCLAAGIWAWNRIRKAAVSNSAVVITR